MISYGQAHYVLHCNQVRQTTIDIVLVIGINRRPEQMIPIRCISPNFRDNFSIVSRLYF